MYAIYHKPSNKILVGFYSKNNLINLSDMKKSHMFGTFTSATRTLEGMRQRIKRIIDHSVGDAEENINLLYQLRDSEVVKLNISVEQCS